MNVVIVVSVVDVNKQFFRGCENSLFLLTKAQVISYDKRKEVADKSAEADKKSWDNYEKQSKLSPEDEPPEPLSFDPPVIPPVELSPPPEDPPAETDEPPTEIDELITEPPEETGLCL